MAKTLFESSLKLWTSQLQCTSVAKPKSRHISMLIQMRQSPLLQHSSLSPNFRIPRKKMLLPQMTYKQYVYFATEQLTTKKMTKSTPQKNLETNLSSSVHRSRSRSDTLPVNKVLSVENLKQKMKTNKSKSFVFDKNVAGHIVKTVMEHRSNPIAPVLELDAGPGYISSELLKQGVSKVVALEQNPDCANFLSVLQQEVGSDRFSFLPWDMANVYMKLYSVPRSEAAKDYHRMEIQTAGLLQSGFHPHNGSNDVPFSLFCLGGKKENNSTIYYIVLSLMNDDVILSQGQVEFFLLVHPRLQAKLDYLSSIKKKTDGVGYMSSRKRSQTIRYSHFHVFIFLLYDVQVIGQVEATDFVPPFSTKEAVEDRGLDCSKRLLIKMQRKKNFNDILPLEQHKLFLYFLRQIYKRKLLRTVPAMEMLIPGCGLRMIAEGFNMMEKIITTQPEDILRLFKLMLDWPEYRSSALNNHIMMRTTGSTVEVGGGDAEEEDEDKHV